MIIRMADTADIKCLNSIMEQSKGYWGYDDDFMKKFMGRFGLNAGYISQKNTFVAASNNVDLGWYSFSRLEDGQLELDNFFLHPDYIGKRLGKMMWDQCIMSARNYTVPSFILWSDPHAEGFYEKMGCIKIGERQSPMLPNRFPAIYKYELLIA